ncbi:MAG TPA: exodeoxyribonuclease III [Saprospiraceae bacterium]|jgi:exodeoxyribonuclease-3|nr:exodeoxyribonuclease III [Candidatus Parvibacillus calidus]MBX2937444.1 exodeoxyribonuclease III [Saprospiraceae bacterium]MCB0589830.1 exodeoxyribonuclease III [Saprospiraceae bacterium]MCO5284278.1 exodeoxyribonuclease III [Saprospiraceae bacterium]MCO6471169.1 exodeoxyribonuclease III [Saprospiraceae bacterium]
MKIYSWNVNGIRASMGKSFLEKFNAFDADIFCLQETKAQEDQVEKALEEVQGYHLYANSAEKKGYSGVAILTKQKPLSFQKGIGVDVHDMEGRVLTLEFDNFYMVNVYVPNSGDQLVRLEYRAEWDDAFSSFLAALRRQKPVVVTGDFNVAHTQIDLARPKENYNKTSGYTQVEIDGMDLILNAGFSDAFRKLYPEKIQYTFWSMRFGARAKNMGWRIDYFLVDKDIDSKITECTIHDQVMGSDHCPISLNIDL